MDTETPLGTELVPLRPNSPQYVEVHGMFHSTLPEHSCRIKRIYRLQNIELWNRYEL